MRITVNVSDICVELEEASNLTIEGVETLLNRAVSAALMAYAGLVDIEGLTPVDEDEESITPDEE